MNQKLQNYQAIDTLGKSMPELIIKVYDGAIYNFAKAIEFYKADNFQDGYDSMEGAKKFIVHLYTSLDKKRGGEIAENLSKLYAYIVERISFVEATKDIASIGLHTYIEQCQRGVGTVGQRCKNQTGGISADIKYRTHQACINLGMKGK